MFPAINSPRQWLRLLAVVPIFFHKNLDFPWRPSRMGTLRWSASSRTYARPNDCFRALCQKVLVEFTSNLVCVIIEWCSERIPFSGFRTLSEKAFIQIISDLAGVLIV